MRAIPLFVLLAACQGPAPGGAGSPTTSPPGTTGSTASTPVTSVPTTSTPGTSSTPTRPVTRELVLPADASLTLIQVGTALPLGDTNGDGVDDVAVSQERGSSWWVDGPVVDPDLGAPLYTSPVGWYGGAVPAGDVTGDGLGDVWLWSSWYHDLSYVSELRSGADPGVPFGGLPWQVAWGASLADASTAPGPETVIPGPGQVALCAAPAAGGMGSCIRVRGSMDADFGAAAAAGDLDGDGDDDLIATARAAFQDEYYCSPRVYRIDGPIDAQIDGIDDVPRPQWLAPAVGQCRAPFDPVIADFDGDGANEIAFGSAESEAPIVRVLDGNLADVAEITGGAVLTVGTGDTDGDGVPELLLGGVDEAWVVPGPFAGVVDLDTAAAVHLTLSTPTGFGATLRVLDRDGDGDADLVMSGEGLGVWFVDGPF